MFDILSKLFNKTSFEKTEQPKIYKISEVLFEFSLVVIDEKQKQEIIFEILQLKHDKMILLEIDCLEEDLLVKILSKEKVLIYDLYEKILKIFWEIKNV
jgi:fructose 1,6-bisphosphatase